MSKKMHKNSARNSHLVVATEFVVSRIQCINYQQNFPRTWDISSKLADFQFYKNSNGPQSKLRQMHSTTMKSRCVSLGDPMGRQGCAPPLGPNSFIFMQFSENILSNTFLPQIQGGWRPPPRCGKYWIRHCILYITVALARSSVRVDTLPDQLFSCSSWCMKWVSSSWSVCSVGSSSSSSSITNSCATLCTTENIFNYLINNESQTSQIDL